MQKTLVLFLVSILSSTSFVLAGKTEGEDSDCASTVSRSGASSTAQGKTNLSSLPDELVLAIADFLLPRDQAAFSQTSRYYCERVRTNAQKTQKQITEKMAQLTEENKAFLHEVFAQELTTKYIACSQTLAFIDRFKENPQIYKAFYKDLTPLLKDAPITKKRAFVRNAEGLGLLNLPSVVAFDRVQAFLPFSVEQLDILGKYGASLIAEMNHASEHSQYIGRNAAPIFQNIKYERVQCLTALRELSSGQLDALGRNAAAIFQNITRHDCMKCLTPLSNFSPEQLDVLGYNAAIFQNIWQHDRMKCLAPLSKFSAEQVNTLVDYADRPISKILLSSTYKTYLELLSSFSAQELMVHVLTAHSTSLPLDERVNIHYKGGLFYRDHPEQDPGHTEAIRSFTRTLELDPIHVKAMHNLAMLHFNLNDLQKAKEWFQKAADLGFEPSRRNLAKMPATDQSPINKGQRIEKP